MAQSKIIPTPISHRWRRFRYVYMPWLFFAFCLVLLGYVWQQQSVSYTTVGTFEAVLVEVTSTADGIVSLPSNGAERWKLHQTVAKGEVLYVIEKSDTAQELIAATRATMTADLDRIKAELGAVIEQAMFDQRNLQHDYQRQDLRLRTDLEERKYRVLELQAEIAVGKAERKRRQEWYDRIKHPDVPLPQAEKDDALNRLLEITTEVEQNEELLVEAKKQGRQAVDRLAANAQLPPALIAKITAPIEQAQEVQRLSIQELELQLKPHVVTAPVSGTIVDIAHWPGQNITAGTSVLTIAEPRGRYIISYVRQEQGISPRKNDRVIVCLRAPGAKPVVGYVDDVGTQYEMVPRHQWRDGRTREWGLPVRIALRGEEKFVAPPGELLNIRFPRN